MVWWRTVQRDRGIHWSKTGMPVKASLKQTIIDVPSFRNMFWCKMQVTEYWAHWGPLANEVRNGCGGSHYAWKVIAAFNPYRNSKCCGSSYELRKYRGCKESRQGWPKVRLSKNIPIRSSVFDLYKRRWWMKFMMKTFTSYLKTCRSKCVVMRVKWYGREDDEIKAKIFVGQDVE